MERSRARVLVVGAAVMLVGAGCAKHGSSEEAAAPAGGETGPAQIVGVGDEQQAAKLARALNERAAEGNPEPVEVHARYALAWSCPCAPIILANASASPPQASYLLPVVGSGETNPAEYEVVGEFRLFGHYAGKQMSLAEWTREGGGPDTVAEGADTAHLQAPYLALIVDHWCYVPPTELSLLEEQAPEDEFAAKMVERIGRLRSEGRFCESSDGDE